MTSMLLMESMSSAGWTAGAAADIERLLFDPRKLAGRRVLRTPPHGEAKATGHACARPSGPGGAGGRSRGAMPRPGATRPASALHPERDGVHALTACTPR